MNKITFNETNKLLEFKQQVLGMDTSELKNFLLDKRNKTAAINYMLKKFLPKEILDKFFKPEVFTELLSENTIKALLNNCDFFKLVNHYKEQPQFSIALFKENVYDLLDIIDSEECVYRFLSIFFLDRRCEIDNDYIDILHQQLQNYPNLSNYIDFKLNKKTLTKKDIVEIINDRFDKNYKNIEQIFNDPNFNIKIAELALRLGANPEKNISNQNIHIKAEITPVYTLIGSMKRENITFQDGKYTIYMPYPGNSSSTGVEFTLSSPEPAVVEFDADISTEHYYDYFRFYINGKQQFSYSGSHTQHYKFNITEGMKSIKFYYSTDCCCCSSHRVYIRNLTFKPL